MFRWRRIGEVGVKDGAKTRQPGRDAGRGPDDRDQSEDETREWGDEERRAWTDWGVFLRNIGW